MVGGVNISSSAKFLELGRPLQTANRAGVLSPHAWMHAYISEHSGSLLRHPNESGMHSASYRPLDLEPAQLAWNHPLPPGSHSCPSFWPVSRRPPQVHLTQPVLLAEVWPRPLTKSLGTLRNLTGREFASTRKGGHDFRWMAWCVPRSRTLAVLRTRGGKKERPKRVWRPAKPPNVVFTPRPKPGHSGEKRPRCFLKCGSAGQPQLAEAGAPLKKRQKELLSYSRARTPPPNRTPSVPESLQTQRISTTQGARPKPHVFFCVFSHRRPHLSIVTGPGSPSTQMSMAHFLGGAFDRKPVLGLKLQDATKERQPFLALDRGSRSQALIARLQNPPETTATTKTTQESKRSTPKINLRTEKPSQHLKIQSKNPRNPTRNQRLNQEPTPGTP